jgi:hypothetical protein
MDPGVARPEQSGRAVEPLVRDGRLDVPKIQAQQLDLLTAELMVIRPMGSSRAYIGLPCGTSATRIRRVIGRLS